MRKKGHTAKLSVHGGYGWWLLDKQGSLAKFIGGPRTPQPCCKALCIFALFSSRPVLGAEAGYLLLVTCSAALDPHAGQLATPAVLDLHPAVLAPAVVAEDVPAPHVCCLLARHITEAAAAGHLLP